MCLFPLVLPSVQNTLVLFHMGQKNVFVVFVLNVDSASCDPKEKKDVLTYRPMCGRKGRRRGNINIFNYGLGGAVGHFEMYCKLQVVNNGKKQNSTEVYTLTFSQ